MYRPQSQPIPEWFTYSDSGAQDEQNEYQHECFSSSVKNLVLKSAIFALDCTFRREILHDVHGIRKWTTFSESASQDEQNEHQHQCCSSSVKNLVLKSAIFALDCTFRREILHDVLGIRKWTTFSDSGAQDEQNEYQHECFSSTRTSVASNGPILPSKFSLTWENPNVGRRIWKWSTYLDWGAQDEQNEPQHRSFSSTRTSVVWNSPLDSCLLVFFFTLLQPTSQHQSSLT